MFLQWLDRMSEKLLQALPHVFAVHEVISDYKCTGVITQI